MSNMNVTKVTFRDLEGFERTAYIEIDHGTYGFGTLKHSESAVWIRWGEPHHEIPPIEAHANELREAWEEGRLIGRANHSIHTHADCDARAEALLAGIVAVEAVVAPWPPGIRKGDVLRAIGVV